MKIRNGFVSNSSSSSFVVFKDALSKIQLDQIFNYSSWVEYFIELDKVTDHSDEVDYDINNSLEEKLSYYNDYPWQIKEYDDCIFGETSMDNFSMQDYFNHIKISDDYVMWDEGYCDDPTLEQRGFIQQMKQKYRKDKLDKIDKSKTK